MAEHRPIGLRAGLARLSTGLIVYGLIGVFVAIVGFGALVWANNRIATLSDRVGTSVEQMATTLDNTAKALQDASSTANGFTQTLDRTSEGVGSAAQTIVGVRTNLQTLESALRAVSILGVNPLNVAANAVGGIASALEGLDTRLTAISDSLEGNRDRLSANATSLAALGESTAALAARLRSGAVEDSLADVQALLIVTLLLFILWSAVPAIGALALGIWLRRETERTPRVVVV
jgi:hypothetical protein